MKKLKLDKALEALKFAESFMIAVQSGLPQPNVESHLVIVRDAIADIKS